MSSLLRSFPSSFLCRREIIERERERERDASVDRQAGSPEKQPNDDDNSDPASHSHLFIMHAACVSDPIRGRERAEGGEREGIGEEGV